MLNLRAFFLFPFTLLYQLITQLRNVLYSRGGFTVEHFPVYTISVGNLNVGGSGKTPHITYLANLLAERFNTAIISRGYKRQTKGVIVAGEQDNARTLGDEPFQYVLRFGKRLPVAVGEKRVHAARQLLESYPATRVLLLDDAYQHRAIGRHLNILLTRYREPFYNDFVIPSGWLRESRKGANRADALIITKCPDRLDAAEMERISNKARKYIHTNCPVFFSTVIYHRPEPVFQGTETMPAEFILLSSIAQNQAFYQYVNQHYSVIEHLAFPDHHHYKPGDLQRLQQLAKNHPGCGILTTEKDRSKLVNNPYSEALRPLPVYYLPISVSFLGGNPAFNNFVLRKTNTFLVNA